MNQDSKILQTASSQFSLIQLFAWITLFSFVASSAALMPTLAAGGVMSMSDTYRPGLTWGVLLAIHIWRREFLSLVVHTVPVVLIFVFLFALQIERNTAVGFMIAMAICSSCASFLLTLVSLAKHLLRNHVSSIFKFACYIVLGLGFAAIIFGALPSLAYRRIHMPAVIFGGAIGAWAGLYHAVATTESTRGFKKFGVSIKVVVLAGMLGAAVLPIVNEVVGSLNGTYIVEPAFTPVAGLLTSALASLGLWVASATTTAKLN